MIEVVRRLMRGVRSFVRFAAANIPGGPWSPSPSGLYGREQELRARDDRERDDAPRLR